MSDMVQVSYQAAHDLSVELFRSFAEEGVPTSLVGAAVALTLGRLMVPPGRDVSEEEEVQFVQDVVQWCAAYWIPAGGAAN